MLLKIIFGVIVLIGLLIALSSFGIELIQKHITFSYGGVVTSIIFIIVIIVMLIKLKCQ